MLVIGAARHLGYLTAMAAIALSVSWEAVLGAKQAVMLLGVIGLWRYGWAALNFARATWFLRIVHPRRQRARRISFAAAGRPAHAFFLITSCRIDPEVSIATYRSVFRAAARAPDGATVLASVVDGADARLVETLRRDVRVTGRVVKVIVDQIAGTGKRDALARSLRLIAREMPGPGDILVVVDGDTQVPEDIAARAAPVFSDPSVGALTTDEAVDIPEPSLFRDWFRLRFDQRQVLMCSMGLSRRVLTLTGRMSVFRAALATERSFITQIEADYVDHWRLGRVPFLTGDDKSTWFWLLKSGLRMEYLPDVQSISAERQPRRTFLGSAITLMTRWFGNMLRTNGRALALGPARTGAFTWWAILDQRVSIWTTLAGPVSVGVAAVLHTPAVLPAYAAWVMMTRYAYVTAIMAFRGRIGFPITYPALLYFGQVGGALVKSFVLFRPDRQRWTRQDIALPGAGREGSFAARLIAAEAAFLHALAFGWLVAGAIWLAGLS